MAQQMPRVTPQMMQQLRELKPHLTFAPDPSTYYTGVHDLAERRIADKAFSDLIDRLVADLPENPEKSFVMKQFSSMLYHSGLFDTEDRERGTRYLEKIMDILGIKSSDGLLNRYLRNYPWWLISQWFSETFGSNRSAK